MEPKICTVIKKHRSSYPNPITLKAGDKVIVGRVFTEDSEWENWQWCTSHDGWQGWIPEQYLCVSGQSGTVLRDYSGRELDVDAGDEITVYETENGWAWSKTSEGEFGWVPLRNIEI